MNIISPHVPRKVNASDIYSILLLIFHYRRFELEQNLFELILKNT